MFIRTGTAIVEIDRIVKSQKNYCVKIAFAKAIGTGMRIIRAKDISILRDRLGTPFVILDGRAKMLEQREGYIVNISVASCQEYATASVIINK